MNDNIQKIVEKYKEQFCNDNGCIDVIAYDSVDALMAEIVKATISELCQQFWNYGIDESNNPNFYKAIEETEQYFGVE